MNKNGYLVAIIPAKHQSVRVKNKNFKKFYKKKKFT